MAICGNSSWYLSLGDKGGGRETWKARQESTVDRN